MELSFTNKSLSKEVFTHLKKSKETREMKEEMRGCVDKSPWWRKLSLSLLFLYEGEKRKEKS
jgi:hypothetical protein